MKPCLTLATAIALLLSARTLPAQSAEVPAFDEASESCLAAIPDSMMQRVPVFLTAVGVDTNYRRMPAAVENLLQVIADRIQVILGAKPPVLVRGEPRVDWRELGPSLRVSWLRDRPLTWAVESDSAGVARPHAAGAQLVAAALDSAMSAGEVFMFWPDSDRTNLIRFQIDLVRPTLDTTGARRPFSVRPAVPVFSVRAPRSTEVVLRGRSHPPSYPLEAQEAGVNATVIASFDVDTTGRADLHTFRDVWPPDTPRLEGELASYYGQFVRSVRRSVANYRFVPARYGGCRVRMTVEQPFTFLIGR